MGKPNDRRAILSGADLQDAMCHLSPFAPR
jgi:hypothetical protein